MTKLRNNNQYIQNIITRSDISNSNRVRREMIKNGADTHDIWQLKYEKQTVDKINTWLTYNKVPADSTRIAGILMLTISDSDWDKISTTKNQQTVNNILERHMNKRTEITGMSLYDVAQTRMTSAQLASGLALDEWDSDTIGAFFKTADTAAVLFPTAYRM